MNKGDETRPAAPEKPAVVPTPNPEEPGARIDFHDPFARFDFEPTDGGEF